MALVDAKKQIQFFATVSKLNSEHPKRMLKAHDLLFHLLICGECFLVDGICSILYPQSIETTKKKGGNVKKNFLLDKKFNKSLHDIL